MGAQIISYAHGRARGLHRLTITRIDVLIVTFHADPRTAPTCARVLVPYARRPPRGCAFPFEGGKFRLATALAILPIEVFVVVARFG